MFEGQAHSPFITDMRHQAVRKRTNQSAVEPSSNVELIASVLPDPSQKPSDAAAEHDADTEDVLREADREGRVDEEADGGWEYETVECCCTGGANASIMVLVHCS